jgi:hypothetical protein
MAEDNIPMIGEFIINRFLIEYGLAKSPASPDQKMQFVTGAPSCPFAALLHPNFTCFKRIQQENTLKSM